MSSEYDFLDPTAKKRHSKAWFTDEIMRAQEQARTGGDHKKVLALERVLRSMRLWTRRDTEVQGLRPVLKLADAAIGVSDNDQPLEALTTLRGLKGKERVLARVWGGAKWAVASLVDFGLSSQSPHREIMPRYLTSCSSRDDGITRVISTLSIDGAKIITDGTVPPAMKAVIRDENASVPIINGFFDFHASSGMPEGQIFEHHPDAPQFQIASRSQVLRWAGVMAGEDSALGAVAQKICDLSPDSWPSHGYHIPGPAPEARQLTIPNV